MKTFKPLLLIPALGLVMLLSACAGPMPKQDPIEACIGFKEERNSDFAADLLGPWAGFFTGWTYWFCWVVTGIADVVAITAYAQFWFPDLSQWIASLLCVLLLLSLNLATVKMFGEMEFWFAMIKIVAIVSLIVVGLVMVAMHA